MKFYLYYKTVTAKHVEIIVEINVVSEQTIVRCGTFFLVPIHFSLNRLAAGTLPSTKFPFYYIC